MSEISYDSDFYRIYFPIVSDPESGTIQTLLRDGLSNGWTTHPDGQADSCRYSGELTGNELEWVSTDAALADIERNYRGFLKVFSEETSFTLEVSRSYESYNLPDVGGVKITWKHVHFRDDIQETIEKMFETAAFVFRRLPAPFAFSRVPADLDYETPVTKEHVTTSKLPDVYWLTLLSEQLSQNIGRDRLETAPVWKAKRLDPDGFGLVVTDNPGDYWREDKQRVKDHLGMDD